MNGYKQFIDPTAIKPASQATHQKIVCPQRSLEQLQVVSAEIARAANPLPGTALVDTTFSNNLPPKLLSMSIAIYSS